MLRFFTIVLVALLFYIPALAQTAAVGEEGAKPVQSVTIEGTEYRHVPFGVTPVRYDDPPKRFGIVCIEEKSGWLYTEEICTWEKEILPLQDGLLVLDGGVESSFEISSATGWGLFGVVCMLIAFVSMTARNPEVAAWFAFGAAFGAVTIVLGDYSLSNSGGNFRIAALVIALLAFTTLMRKRRYLPRFLGGIYIILMIVSFILP